MDPSIANSLALACCPPHLRAMQDIEQCCTAALGGQLYFCKQCQQPQANLWLAAQQNLLLPVAHFMVTFTLPAELRAVARRNQKLIYNLLFRASAAALLKLALDPRFVGAQIDMVGVLHSWTRQLLYYSEGFLPSFVFRVAPE
jgi:Transposase zinc-binding domain